MKVNVEHRLFRGKEVPWVVTIGVDPGTNAALAAWVWDKLVYVSSVSNKRRDAQTRRRALVALLKTLGVETVGDKTTGMVLVCEEQFLPRDRDTKQIDPRRFPSAVKVAENAARWEELASLFGLQVVDRVVQQTWRSTFALATPKIKDKAAAAVRFVASRAREALNGREPSQDVAEAVLIGLHVHINRLERFGLEIPKELYHWVAYSRRRDDRATRQSRGHRTGRGKRRGGRRQDSGQGTLLP